MKREPARTGETDIIRASELGEYVYCARAWWLQRVRKVSTRNTAALWAGQRAHDRHARSVAGFRRQQRLAVALLALAGLLLAVGLGIALGGGPG